MYGMSAFRLSRELGIPRGEAEAYISGYFRRHSGVKRWIDATVEAARETGEVRTLLGRRRLIPEIRSGNFQLRSAAERKAVNTPIQGTAADLIKVAMIDLDRLLATEAPEARILLQVHDELLIEAPEDQAERVAEMARAAMSGVRELAVKLNVDLGVAKNWADAH
jgi:DNA polymerase-1